MHFLGKKKNKMGNKKASIAKHFCELLQGF